ncbi:tyrosinase family protein [Okeania sp. KiyG1]|uniref:tyrosinase family protein n=1 Tax=Okeania sp. KiyG1 TaxID=2720165 RepID=UPI00192422B0|nr:tyrosinase family protein [Okeania sp. KiyG1]GGA34946.1 hypothetical protein CYANOKiyG1_52460 [Okeania sp. KiyG1]
MSVNTFIGEAVADTPTETVADTPTISCNPHIRYEASTECGKKNLKSLEKALKRMKAMGCEDPLSWYYQGSIHWVPTAASGLSGLIMENPLCPFYSEFSVNAQGNPIPDTGKLLTSWDNCTHDSAGTSGIHFLPWHRLYVYHFEKIVRKLSNNPDFNLPYWNYISLFDTQIPDKSRLTMPKQFYTPADDSNSLYESGRDPGLNNGGSLDHDFAKKNLLDAVEGLKKGTVYEDFNTTIDIRPHGLMHNYLGGYYSEENQNIFNIIYNRSVDDQGNPQFGLMTNVPSAGFDPIFWMHHGNIDRLWAQWTQLPKTQPVTQEELEKVSWPYQFFEPNGQVKGYTMQEVIEAVYNMDYVYDDGTRPNLPVQAESTSTPFIAESTSTAPTAKALKAKIGKKVLVSKRTRKKVGQNQEFIEPVLIDSQFLPQLRSNRSNLQLDSQPESDEPVTEEGLSQPEYLEVSVTYTGHPLGIYEVYLNLPNEEESKKAAIADIDTYFLGTMAFFVLDSDRPTSKTFLFDITDEVLEQGKKFEEFNPDLLSISILKNGGPVDETITVDNISIFTRE